MKLLKKVVPAFILLLFSFFIAFAQKATVEKSNQVQVIDGKKYYLHTIVKGQTLYAISKAYDVTVNDIVIENPELIDALPLNKIIKIPFKETKKTEQTVLPEGDYKLHSVERGETFYSICKKYNLRIEQLAAANPETEKGIKKGQILKIPIIDTVAKTVVVPADTVPQPVLKESYNVVFMLPFFLEMNEEDKVYKTTTDKETIYPKSEIAVAFYLGALAAMDSLKKLGFNARAHFYDTGNDSIKVEEILRKKELKEADLIIGPLYAANFTRVAEFAKQNKIAIVSPFSQLNKILLGNASISKVTPSLVTQIEQVSLYITDKYKFDNIVLIHNDGFKEKQYIELFRKKAGCYPASDSLLTPMVKEVSYKKQNVKGIQDVLSTTRKNVVFIPSADQAFVTDVFNSLSGLVGTYEFILFGMDNWVSFDNIDIDHMEGLHLHLPQNAFIDYKNGNVKSFIKNYRAKNQSEPDKYSFYGYDITYYYSQALSKYGHNFIEMLPEFKQEMLQTKYDFFKTGVESGFENKGLFILQHTDYELKKVN